MGFVEATEDGPDGEGWSRYGLEEERAALMDGGGVDVVVEMGC